MRKPTIYLASCVMASLFLMHDARALAINLTFVVDRPIQLTGQRFEPQSPTATVGGGDFRDILELAAQIWESMIFDDRTFRIVVGWGTLPSNTVAAAGSYADSFNELVFNNRLAVPHFADPTPDANAEFGAFEETTADLGGGLINVGRGFRGTADGAFGALPFGGVDLLSTALHEIGHILGNPFDGPVAGIEFPIIGGPFDGTVLPCATQQGLCAHLNLRDALMNPFGGDFSRAMISGADLLFVASDGRFQNIDYSIAGAVAIPEPPALGLLALVALLTFSWQRRMVAGRIKYTPPSLNTLGGVG